MNKLKQLVPPFILDYKRKLFPSRYGWFGDYSTWEEASQDASGYDSDIILNKVLRATQAVLKGEAEFERDSVLFYEKDYQFHISTALLWIASQKNLQLSVLDFGGALGSTYFQNRLFLDKLNVTWNIVEQHAFVEAGQAYIENERLKFHHTIKECASNYTPDLLLLSSVLAYLPEPYKMLEEMFSYNFQYLIIDKHPFIHAANDRLTVQKVQPDIYEANYPAWFFSKQKFLDFLTAKYEIIYDYQYILPNSIGADFTCIVARLK